MTSIHPLWWLALPVLLLPVWWHLQKRQRAKAELLATARFLPIAAPEQQRVWRLRDRLLLVLRCLLLVGLITWLAALVLPWRGDTVLLDSAVDRGWAEQQIKSAGMEHAKRMTMPGDVLSWLREQERDWRPDARLLLLAAPGSVPMPAHAPRFAHAVDLRVPPLQPAQATQAAARAAAATATGGALRQHHVVLATTPARRAAWQAMFAAFDVAGVGADRFILADTPDTSTELIIWDLPAAPPAAWRAPLWWRVAAPGEAKSAPLTINGLTLHITDSAAGRIWSSDAWPAKEADLARAIYETWQALSPLPAAPYPAPSHTFSKGASATPASVEPLAWLVWTLLALFVLERILTHARRT